jgi:hypothetical protein
MLGALVGAPVLVAAPAAEAQAVPAVMVQGGPEVQLLPAQYGPPPGYYRGRGHWHRPPPPPPRHYRRHHAYRGYPPPPPRYYRHPRPYYYR